MEAGQQQRLRTVVAGETRRLGELVDRLEAFGESLAGGGPAARQRVAAGQLAAQIAARAYAHLGLRIEKEEGDTAGFENAALEIDFETLVHAAVDLLTALRRELAVSEIRLRQRVVEKHAVFDLLWQAEAGSLDHLRQWQSEALEKTADGGPGLRPILRRHGGEAWFNVDRDASRAYLRILLPLAG